MSGKGNGRIRRLAALLLCTVLLFGAARADTVRFRGLEVDSGIENLDMGKIQIWDWDKFYEFLDQLPNLNGAQVHSTVMLGEVDRKTFYKLGIGLTCDPVI